MEAALLLVFVGSSLGRTKVLGLTDVDGVDARSRPAAARSLSLPSRWETTSILTRSPRFRNDGDVAKQTVRVGIVGGSDLSKISEQLGDGAVHEYDFVFSENGLVAHQAGDLLATQSLKTYLGEDKLKAFLNFVLRYIADLDIPIKRGTFVEFRNGMLNVSPIGRNCSQDERDEFERYDKEANVRSKMVDVLKKTFAEYNLTYSIGGQISFDVFPNGWDKTFCLRFLEAYDEIHFFGDKTYPGGNDFEIYTSERTIGHTVTSPEDTMKQVTEIFLS